MKQFIDKLISRLEELQKQNYAISEVVYGINEKVMYSSASTAYANAIEEINKLAEEYNGWIPCSERLPSVGVTVLCYWKKWDRYDNTTSYYYTLMHRDEDCKWLSEFGLCNGVVLAWQPLPAPYKKGE